MERKYSFHKEKVRLIIGESNYQKKQRLSWHKNLYLLLAWLDMLILSTETN